MICKITDAGAGFTTASRSRASRGWVAAAVAKMNAENLRSADTHLLRVDLPGTGAQLYLKDESTHPTGSLKHRLARSLILYHLCNGSIGPETTLVEASSGSTAVSEAYFARMLGLEFVAVMPRTTSQEKVRLIERHGGKAHFVDTAESVYEEAQAIAARTDGLYLDQFTYAERATDWRGNNNIADSILDQLQSEPYPEPRWIVMGAGTGGTSATIGRYLRFRGLATRLAVADPESSAFFDGYVGDPDATASGSRIEGIGRPRVEPSFVPEVIDLIMRVPDEASIAAMQLLKLKTGIEAGPSTGASLCVLLHLACRERATSTDGFSLVTVVCDSAHRYVDTYLNPRWISSQGWQPERALPLLEAAWENGVW